jgi:DNA-binding transcriptional LysR family regulator
MKPKIEGFSNGINIFAAIVDAGTFSGAAEIVGMSPPGVSRAVARLENRLKIRLFHRTTRAVSLTEEGQSFYERILPHLIGLEEAAAEVSGVSVSVGGRLRVNLDPVCYRAIMGAHLDRFMDQHPELRLEFIARDSLGDLVSEGFDVALRFGKPKNSTLVARKVLDTAIVTLASPSYLARQGRPMRPQDVEDPRHRCLEFLDPTDKKPFPWEFHQGRKKVVITTRGRLTVNDPSALLDACLAGSGIAQMLSIGAVHLIEKGQLVNLFPDWADERYPLYAFHPSRQHVPAKTRAFLDFIEGLKGA